MNEKNLYMQKKQLDMEYGKKIYKNALKIKVLIDWKRKNIINLKKYASYKKNIAKTNLIIYNSY